MNFKSMVAVVTMGAAIAANAYEVRNVSASSRWPWNGLVYVDYELVRGDSPFELYTIDVTATAEDGVRQLSGHTIVSGRVAGVGQNRVVWDFGADHPGIIARDLKVTVTATPKPVHPGTELYCVIDLSAGPNATYYPVRYETTGPSHVQGASNEVCQTTEMWFRRVGTGPYPFHGTDSNGGKGYYQVKFSHAFYCAIFECTQQQWYQVMGTWPSRFSNEVCRASRPVESITHTDLLGHETWPDSQVISDDSFVGRLRARTGLKTFNMPTEAQWEYVCRAGATKSSVTCGKRYSSNCGKTSGYNYNEDVSYATAFVGTYDPNAWGFYDCLGNVREWCLDAYVGETALKALYADEITEFGFVTDPIGPLNKAITSKDHMARGGAWDNSASYACCYARDTNEHGTSSMTKGRAGVRFVMTCE